MKTDERIRCRKCLLEDTDDKSLYEKIKRTVEEMDPDVRTDDKEYRRRLELCRQCDKLLAGMWLFCGNSGSQPKWFLSGRETRLVK